jgi:hypothetical protein
MQKRNEESTISAPQQHSVQEMIQQQRNSGNHNINSAHNLTEHQLSWASSQQHISQQPARLF